MEPPIDVVRSQMNLESLQRLDLDRLPQQGPEIVVSDVGRVGCAKAT